MHFMSAITSSIRTFSNRGSCYGERAGADLSAAPLRRVRIVCEPILEKVSAALRHSQVRKRIALSDEELDRYVQALRYMADVIDPAGVVVQTPADKNDELILATLIVARANWLVTGDAALLALADR